MLVTVAVTYALATLFSIAGMGAAGVLVPNYIMLGASLPIALTTALSQNVAELSVATMLNYKRGLLEWRKVAPLTVIAIIFVPVGYLVHIHTPTLGILTLFELFLLYALYTMTSPRNATQSLERRLTIKHYTLAALQGIIAGTIGMDAAPIAILAYNTIIEHPKKVSANTAATALGVSSIALFLYGNMLAKTTALPMTLIVAAATAGLLGGVTGAKLMHVIHPIRVKQGMITLLILAAIEVYVKTITMALQNTLTLMLIQIIILGTAGVLGIKRATQNRPSLTISYKMAKDSQ